MQSLFLDAHVKDMTSSFEGNTNFSESDDGFPASLPDFSISGAESTNVEIKHAIKKKIKETWCEDFNRPDQADDNKPNSTEMARQIKADIGESGIYGGWTGEFCGVKFILNFSENGEMSEKTDGIIRRFAYRLENRVLIINPSISDLNCVLGEELTVSFIDSDSIIVRGDLWKMEMVRGEELD